MSNAAQTNLDNTFKQLASLTWRKIQLNANEKAKMPFIEVEISLLGTNIHYAAWKTKSDNETQTDGVVDMKDLSEWVEEEGMLEFTVDNAGIDGEHEQITGTIDVIEFIENHMTDSDLLKYLNRFKRAVSSQP